MMVFLKRLLTLSIITLAPMQLLAASYQVQSPDGQLILAVETQPKLQLSVSLNSNQIIKNSTIDLLVEGTNLADNSNPVSIKQRQGKHDVYPIVQRKNAHLKAVFNELSLTYKSGLTAQFRAYDQGIAYRFQTHLPGNIRIDNEVLNLQLPDNTFSLFPEEESLVSHFERIYLAVQVNELNTDRFASLPVYFRTPGNVHVLFSEADLYDYPGLFLRASGQGELQAKFTPRVKKAIPKPGSEDRNEILEYHHHIAKTNGNRSYPWRVAAISHNAGDLVESELVYLLSRENNDSKADFSWVKPGRVAWDWFNANNLYNVDFVTGINTRTYKYYIDFASKYGLEYVILDEGWTKTTTNILQSNPDIDVHELIAYGKKKNVRIILWTLWKPLNRDYKNILASYAQWGVAGIKVDFMQRADQEMVNYYEKIAREAAKNKLLVNYHGGFKPSGLRRAYPNVISYEGVKGNENNKWSHDITPEHNVTLAFVRMFAGPMDYTPGAMRNTQVQNHGINHFRPMSMGTRAHQVAMYVVYESPLQMLCDSPSNYLREHEVTRFISAIPSVWDETRVLDAAVGDYILIARRRGNTWYVGAMTDGSPRHFTLELSFLDDGDYQIQSLEDGLNTKNFAEDYRLRNRRVNKHSNQTIKLAAGGGWTGIIRPAKQ